jgi:hypothetical protein
MPFDFGNKQENDQPFPRKRFRLEKVANSLNKITTCMIAFLPIVGNKSRSAREKF